ncbi:nucleolar protein 14 [Crepidotus variabilis]|uniref:Nucleolar protein 14 n=1 Tax=Crepidotus variabilis TaxID=179855 RepID=A0A9P6ER75_9AGAR|nr:nucleolar protein 14 [Crepidotus variabilis]
MPKGSQLSQLKSALSNAGIIGQPSGNKRKRAALTEKDKEKRVAKLDEIHRRLNPFDLKVTKLKHDVGGRKLKGIAGKPAQSKQAGIEQRKQTLLKEYETKDRAGGIVDRRFGENDPSMSLEERMLERFTRERQRASKGVTFNLEDENNLTHYGQSLSKLDDFDNVGLQMDSDDEDVDSGQISRDIVSKSHFGGFDENEESDDDEEGPARKKSKTEVMAEVMAKSKEHKLRRQMEKDAADNVRHELDDQFAALRDLIFVPDPSASGSNATPLGNKQTSEAPGKISVDVATSKELNPDDYDQHVRELAFDKRAKPTDRSKTDEELALEAKEALEKAEKKRRKRMLGLPESDSERESGKSRGKRKRGADDLEDDFEAELGEYEDLGSGLRERASGLVEESDGEGEEEGEEEDEEEDGDLPSVDEDGDSSDQGEERGHEELVSPKGKRGKEILKQPLPFTFPCPGTHEEFLNIVENVDEAEIPTVVQRIRTLHHTSFAPENKSKLQELAGVLIDHVLYVSAASKPQFDVISNLFPHIQAIAQTYPIPIAQQFNEKLLLMHKNLKRGISRGPLSPSVKTWPGLPELSLLRLIGLIWPTSDLNHAVVSPTRILMGAYLGLCRVRSLVDMTSGMFLSTLFFQYEALSKRLVPEAINFLINTILHLAPHKFTDLASLPGGFACPDFRSNLCQPLALKYTAKKKLVSRKPNLSDLIAADEQDEQAKADLLSLSLQLLAKYADMYKGLDGFLDLFSPIAEVLRGVESKSLFDGHKTQLATTIDTLQRLLKFAGQARKPLRLQSHKPIPIPSYVPKFESSSSNYLRKREPDHEKNQSAKLRAQYKQERKGAIRELRKDAKFLANVEQKKQVEKDRAYNDRMRRVFGGIEGERAEQKKMEREKAKDKRRAGWK